MLAARLCGMSRKDAGWQHFASADWAEARDAFAAALEQAPGDPEALARSLRSGCSDVPSP